MLLLALICLVLGGIYILSPRTVWKLRNGRKHKGEEPTAEALKYCRIGGVVLLGMAVILTVKYFVMR